MKKILFSMFLLVFGLCLVGCNLYEKDENVTCKKSENSAVFTFDEFSANETISFELERTGLGEGPIYYQVNLVAGALSIKYKDTGLIHQEQPLGEFSADTEMPINGSGGYVEGDKITITFESDSPIIGEIIIAFTEDALEAVHGNLHHHEHTSEWHTNETTHYYQYTCGCPSPDIAELHIYDENHVCDICGYVMAVHEHTYGDWQCDEFKHWREYTCGCELEAEIDTHTNDDGDALCDDCGYNVGVKEDYVIYCQYYYTNEYGSHTHTQISLDDLDVSVLAEISNSLTYTVGDPGSSPTKINYCIRHYDTDTDPFFVTGDEQYLDLSANFTNERADVTYSIDYVNSQIVRKYTTPEGEVEEYAELSAEHLNAIKASFQPIADILEPQG